MSFENIYPFGTVQHMPNFYNLFIRRESCKHTNIFEFVQLKLSRLTRYQYVYRFPMNAMNNCISLSVTSIENCLNVMYLLAFLFFSYCAKILYTFTVMCNCTKYMCHPLNWLNVDCIIRLVIFSCKMIQNLFAEYMNDAISSIGRVQHQT